MQSYSFVGNAVSVVQFFFTAAFWFPLLTFSLVSSILVDHSSLLCAEDLLLFPRNPFICTYLPHIFTPAYNFK